MCLKLAFTSGFVNNERRKESLLLYVILFPFLFRFKTLLIDFTHYHRESGLFMCVSIKLERLALLKLASSLSIHPLLIPSSSGLDLQMALTVI